MEDENYLKIRRIGNSLGAIFPSGWQVHEGDEIHYDYSKEGEVVSLELDESRKRHDRELIEKGFADFEAGLFLTDEDMKKRFGKYGWH